VKAKAIILFVLFFAQSIDTDGPSTSTTPPKHDQGSQGSNAPKTKATPPHRAAFTKRETRLLAKFFPSVSPTKFAVEKVFEEHPEVANDLKEYTLKQISAKVRHINRKAKKSQ
jgi:hypothetical protein